MDFRDMNVRQLVDEGQKGIDYFRLVRDEVSARAGTVSQLASQWELEAVKHLIILHGAIIAGCFTLKDSVRHLILPFVLSSAGLLICMFLFLSTSILLFAIDSGLKSNFERFLSGSITVREVFDINKIFWVRCNYVAGIVSLVLWFCAGLTLIQGAFL
ncbi:hypothetical protein [Chromobacterium violaceum]|uniref:hypothetical protein n=1 Tax=Chromobacterium violaceum TaxID=536 RepID=UPI0015FBD12D|nr:hypothetical protein [Chromobacterium violaceum]MBA8737538.1 hypothetical protein [Chromobacterium violaceum]